MGSVPGSLKRPRETKLATTEGVMGGAGVLGVLDKEPGSTPGGLC